MLGQWATGTVANTSVTTGSYGQSVLTIMIGVSGAGDAGLCLPNAWIPIVGPNQQKCVLPAYLYT